MQDRPFLTARSQSEHILPVHRASHITNMVTSRSNAATARLLILVKPAETLACDGPNTNAWREMVTSTIILLSTIYRWNIKLTGTLRHVLRILQTTINDSLKKAGLLTENKHHWIVINSYWHRTNDLLTESSKTNHERTTGQLTIWLTINNCLTATIDRSNCTNDITSLHSQ